MRLHVQPGTLESASGGMTSVMATPITAWLWHALHAIAHATWHTCECLWRHDIGHCHTNHSLAVACCCLWLHMQPGTLECLWCHDIGHGHTNHSLAVACGCMRLHMQPGTLMSARGGMTSVMTTPITAWLRHAVACGCTYSRGTLSACGGMTSVMATPFTA